MSLPADLKSEMLDPGLEHMHRHGRVWRATFARHFSFREGFNDLALVVPVIALFLVGPVGSWAPPWEVAVLILASALTSTVRFEIGSGSTTPMQLVLIPLWFAVPSAWLPVAVGLSLVIGGAIEFVREPKDGRPFWGVLINAGDAWPAIGPAVVLTVFGAPEPSLANTWIFVLAFAAQVGVDLFIGLANPWIIHGLRPKVVLPLMGWIIGVDAALAPIGFLAAVVMVDQPAAVFALFPLVVLIGEFARERKDRLDQALQLSSTYRGTAQLMGDVLEADDAYTGGEHTQGVVDMAIAVGLEMRLTPREMRDLEFGALLHDIGKLRVPNEIINKPGALDDAEWRVIRKHPEYGQEMLDRVGGAMTDAGRIVRAHHERWDGNGYPDRLVGDEIPLAARIITVCDSFSAMTTTRSYRTAMSHDEGVLELQRCTGSQFDPGVVEALFRVIERNPELRLDVANVPRVGYSAEITRGLGFIA